MAGARFFAGYPITPANEIMVEWANAGTRNKQLSFLQTEDEIAAINSIIGASITGKKSFTATSGPGFSLMQEGIGFAFVTQTPLVIVDAQRQGPSTGMPTVAAQGDLLQTQYGTHGDHLAMVFYPYSVEECFRYTIEAFNAAEESLSPVILMTDALVSHMFETADLEYRGKIVDRQKKACGDGLGHLTGLVNIDGQLATKNPTAYAKWLADTRNRIIRASSKYAFYEYSGNKKSDVLIVSFGIVARLLSDDKFSKSYALFRPIRLFPVLEKEIVKAARNHKKIVVAEMNEGQYSLIIRSILKDRDILSLPIRGGKFDDLEKRLAKLVK